MKERGSSLLEVIIAIMILGVSVAVLVGGMFISRLLSDHSATKVAALVQIKEVAQQLSAMPFNPCTQPNNIYPTPAPQTSKNLPPVSLQVQVLDQNTNTWILCTGDAVTAKKGVQLITISTKVSRQILTKTLVKVRG